MGLKLLGGPVCSLLRGCSCAPAAGAALQRYRVYATSLRGGVRSAVCSLSCLLVLQVGGDAQKAAAAAQPGGDPAGAACSVQPALVSALKVGAVQAALGGAEHAVHVLAPGHLVAQQAEGQAAWRHVRCLRQAHDVRDGAARQPAVHWHADGIRG